MARCALKWFIYHANYSLHHLFSRSWHVSEVERRPWAPLSYAPPLALYPDLTMTSQLRDNGLTLDHASTYFSLTLRRFGCLLTSWFCTMHNTSTSTELQARRVSDTSWSSWCRCLYTNWRTELDFQNKSQTSSSTR